MLKALFAVGAFVAHGVPFRAPAIPIFTTDPFMQTWIRGDSATFADVTHWHAAAYISCTPQWQRPNTQWHAPLLSHAGTVRLRQLPL
jgi:hypothetical protein